MSGCVDPKVILPRRYILRPGVVSPLTARYTNFTGSACQGQQPDASPAHATTSTAQARPGHQKAPARATAAHASAEDLRRELQDFHEIFDRVLFTIRGFPEAADAVAAMLRPGCPPEHDGPGQQT